MSEQNHNALNAGEDSQTQNALNVEDSRMHNTQNAGDFATQNAGQNLTTNANATAQNIAQGNAQGLQNLTPQEYAKLEEFVKMSFDFARNDDAQSLKIMLENGLNPNLANHKGDSLLMLASYHNALACVRLLLDFGANVDMPNDRGHTPLAGVCFKGYAQVAKLLLESGANPNGFDEINGSLGSAILSPINTAIMFRRKEILALLLQYNAKKLPLWKRLYAKITGLQ